MKEKKLKLSVEDKEEIRKAEWDVGYYEKEHRKAKTNYDRAILWNEFIATKYQYHE